MMKTPVLLAAILAAVVDTVVGVPVDTAAGSGSIVQRTAPVGIQMWSQAEYTGHYVHYTAPQIAYGQCVDITSQFPPGTSNGLMSVRVDHLNFCTLFPNKVCDPGNGLDEDRLWVGGQYHDLGGAEIGWGDRAQSFSCRYCPDCGN